MRQDLLALTADDLAALSTRGNVKRAQRELEAGKETAAIKERHGTVIFIWSDGVTCTLPPNEKLDYQQCSCPATSICRHLVRSVFTYQVWAQSQAIAQEQVAAATGPWNPAAIRDEQLGQFFPTVTLNRLRKQFEAGLVVELLQNEKPTARFYELSCTVRFLVPYDLNYTHCNCTETAPCTHVALAVWAFRHAAEATVVTPNDTDTTNQAFLLETKHQAAEVPEVLIGRIETMLRDLLELGISSASTAVAPRLLRLAEACEQEGLTWPATILEEIRIAYEQYMRHDARFDPQRVVQLIGELLIRLRYIRQQSTAVPDLFVRGGHQQIETRTGTTRFTGLGCGVTVLRGSVTLSAYLQDIKSGEIVAVEHSFADPKPEDQQSPRPFWELAQQQALQNNSFHSVGEMQIMVKGGKRSVGGIFDLGRARASANPQSFRWNELVAPVLAETFAEVKSRLALQPPSSLRPRHVGDDVYVCAITHAAEVHFDFREQQTVAVVYDSGQQTALLLHPHTNRGSEGSERLLFWLNQYPQQLRFVSAQAQLDHGVLILRPFALIFEQDGRPVMIQPWIDRLQKGETASEPVQTIQLKASKRLAPDFLERVREALGGLWLSGLQRVDVQTIAEWRQLAHEAAAMGFVRLADAIQDVAQEIEKKQHASLWEWQAAVTPILELVFLNRFAQEQLSFGAVQLNKGV